MRDRKTDHPHLPHLHIENIDVEYVVGRLGRWQHHQSVSLALVLVGLGAQFVEETVFQHLILVMC